jgi:hypothetical protein
VPWSHSRWCRKSYWLLRYGFLTIACHQVRDNLGRVEKKTLCELVANAGLLGFAFSPMRNIGGPNQFACNGTFFAIGPLLYLG